jgi:hypothetical protein
MACTPIGNWLVLADLNRRNKIIRVCAYCALAQSPCQEMVRALRILTNNLTSEDCAPSARASYPTMRGGSAAERGRGQEKKHKQVRRTALGRLGAPPNRLEHFPTKACPGVMAFWRNQAWLGRRAPRHGVLAKPSSAWTPCSASRRLGEAKLRLDAVLRTDDDDDIRGGRSGSSQKIRKDKNLKRVSDSVGTERALAHRVVLRLAAPAAASIKRQHRGSNNSSRSGRDSSPCSRNFRRA